MLSPNAKTIIKIDRDANGNAFPDVGEDRLVNIDYRTPASKILFGDQREELIPVDNRIDFQFLSELQSYFWKMDYVLYGLPDSSVLYNLGQGGTANNITQSYLYQIMSVDGDTVHVKGPDPRCLEFGISTPNPEWLPLPPDQQTQPRLLNTTIKCRMPIGSSVQFQYPSCLFGRLNPWVSEVYPPSGTLGGEKEFAIKLSHSANSAMIPWDLLYPPIDGKYFLTISAYLVAPGGYDNFQPSSPEAQFVKVYNPFIVPELAGNYGYGYGYGYSYGYGYGNGLEEEDYLESIMGPQYIYLKNNENEHCRVLPAPIKIRAHFYDGSSLLLNDISERFSSIDTGVNEWVSRVFIGSLYNVSHFEATYFAEAVSGDENIFNMRGRCSHSQKSIDGYGDADGFYCRNTNCTKFQAGKYGGKTCWDTRATGFTLLPQEANAQRDLLGKYWSSEPLTLQQGAAGSQAGSAASSYFNFFFNKTGGRVASILSLVGGFFNGKLVAPGFAATESWFGPRLGKLETFLEGEDTYHRLVHGFFQTKDGIGPAQYVDTWDTRINQRGADKMDIYPTHYGPSCSVVNFQTGENPAPYIRLARPSDSHTFETTEFSIFTSNASLQQKARNVIQ